MTIMWPSVSGVQAVSRSAGRQSCTVRSSASRSNVAVASSTVRNSWSARSSALPFFSGRISLSFPAFSRSAIWRVNGSAVSVER